MRLREPLLLPAASLAAGICAGREISFEAGPALTGAVSLAALGWVAMRFVTVRAAWAAALAAIFLFGIAVDRWHRPGPPPRIDFESGERMLLEGCVVEPPALSEDREQFIVELAPRARVRVTFHMEEDAPPPALRYGERIALEARLRKPRNFLNPGAFDHAGYLARRHVYWLASANARSKLRRLPGACGSALFTPLYRAREFAVSRLDRLYASDPFALGVSRALLAGDGARLEEVWKDNFQRTGTYHALVVSGTHLVVLSATFLFLLRVLSVSVGWCFFWTASIGWAYALFCGATPPVVRAAAGLTLYWLGRCFHRKPRVLNLLAAVATGFLLADPDSLFDPSFQFSFLAVALIGGIAAPLLERTSDPYARGFRELANARWDRHLPATVAEMRVELRLIAETLRWAFGIPDRATLACLSAGGRTLFFFWGLFVVSAVIQLGMALPMILYFHRVSISGLTANLMIVPLINLMVPLGFAIVLTGSGRLAQAGGAALDAARSIVETHARLEPFWRVPDPPAWLGCLFCLALLTLAATLRRGGKAAVALGAAFCLVAFGALVSNPTAPDLPVGEVEFTAVDVGQGDGLLIASPKGRVMLIDSGGFPVFGSGRKAPAIDTGEDVISPVLFRRAIRGVDVIVITHAHADHTGGLRALARNFRPREIWTGAIPAKFPWIDLQAELTALGARIVPLRAGDLRNWDGLRIEALSPPADYEPGAAPRNEDSLALRVDYGDSSFLLMGDVERRMEQRMLSDGLVRRADVLKVAHHGSKSSTTEEFLAAARPTWAVISDGADNVFRHPHPDVIGRLQHAGVRILRTDRDGQVTIRTDGRRWTVHGYAWPGLADD